MKISMVVASIIIGAVFFMGMIPMLIAIFDLDKSFYSNPLFNMTLMLGIFAVFLIALSKGRPGEVQDRGSNFGGTGAVFRSR